MTIKDNIKEELAKMINKEFIRTEEIRMSCETLLSFVPTDEQAIISRKRINEEQEFLRILGEFVKTL